MSTEGGLKAVIAAMLANGGIAVSKFVAFAITGSSSLLSEAIHSVADTGNQALLLLGNRRAKRIEDSAHNFGYGRLRYIYAFVVSIILFLLGGVFSVYEGVHKIQHPEELNRPSIAFAVLIIAVILEGISWRTAFREANRSRGSTSLLGYIRRARQPELPVVLLEDTGALVGLLFALFGVSMAVITGDGRWDGIGAMAVGVLLLVIAIFLAFEMASLLVGESALPEQEDLIRAAATATPGLGKVISLRTVHIGPDTILVALKVDATDIQSAADLARAINAAEVRIRQVVPSAQYIYIEPDLFLADYQSAKDPKPHGDTPEASVGES